MVTIRSKISRAFIANNVVSNVWHFTDNIRYSITLGVRAKRDNRGRIYDIRLASYQDARGVSRTIWEAKATSKRECLCLILNHVKTYKGSHAYKENI